jgi:hypothetical protein
MLHESSAAVSVRFHCCSFENAGSKQPTIADLKPEGTGRLTDLLLFYFLVGHVCGNVRGLLELVNGVRTRNDCENAKIEVVLFTEFVWPR